MTTSSAAAETGREMLARIRATWTREWGRHHSSRATELPVPCDRRLYYLQTEGPRRQPTPDRVAAMEVGEMFEAHRLAVKLRQIGCHVVTRDDDPRSATLEDTARRIGGRIDLFIQDNGYLAPIEGKKITHYVCQSIREGSLEDVLTSKYWWVRRYPGQLLTYLWCPRRPDQAPYGWLVLLCERGCWNIIAVDAEDPAALDYATQLLARAERVKAAVDSGTEPARLAEYDEDVCGHCDWREHCWPDGTPSRELAALVADTEFSAALRTYLVTREAAGEHERASKIIKDRLSQTEPTMKLLMLSAAEASIVRRRIDVSARHVPARDQAAYSYFRTSIRPVTGDDDEHDES